MKDWVNLMFCKNCGNKMEKDDLFCTNCGTKIKSNLLRTLYLILGLITIIITISIISWNAYDNYAFKSKKYCDYFNENIGGIGIVIAENKDKKIVIKQILKNFPAEKVGLKENDEILKINNKAVNNYDLAIKELRGNKNTKVKIVIKRNNEELKFDLMRTSILPESGYFEIFDNVRLRQNYLKYDDGRYYFWLKILPGSLNLPNNNRIKYATELVIIDLPNQKIATPEYYVYDKKGNVIDSQSDDEKNTEYSTIVPDSVGYNLLQLTKNFDNDIPNRYKKRLKGYFN